MLDEKKNFFIYISILLLFTLIIIVGEIIIRNSKNIKDLEFYKPDETPNYVVEVIQDYINLFCLSGQNLKDYIFIDLGCGIGNIIDLVSGETKLCIGVENNKYIYSHLLDKYSKLTNEVKIINSDIIDFNFPDDNLIIYIYEPFVYSNNPITAKNLKDNRTIRKIYKKLFNNLQEKYLKNGKTIIVIYCSSLINKPLNKEFLDTISNLKLLNHTEIPFSNLIPILNYDLFLYQIT